ncbi:hypothetical protein HH310_04620 [Actinoplanes sp. TBRC 11911]|uniref:hypothetical protein n=1 Tax=Actinoplanes sp. TBRC 11911 TaxID=2729386 RepID=UPI00145F0E17|nr:hypothetical protein [Actinoplanes sp. TBRC 11911]NMO50476.1 hypothetical protein [Actinoplanes sp. TBRC 11911]
MRVWWTAITAATALVTACIVAAAGQEGAPGEDMVLTHGGRQGNDYRFGLAGKPIKGLYPGASRRINITVTNPYGFALSLHHVSARLVSTSNRGCPATSASLRVGDYTGRLPVIIKPRDRRVLPGSIAVAMPRNATPKCSNARFTIALSSTGSRTAR